MRIVSDQIVGEMAAHILRSITFLLENRFVYEIMWKYVVETDRLQMTLRHMSIACCIPKATNAH